MFLGRFGFIGGLVSFHDRCGVESEVVVVLGSEKLGNGWRVGRGEKEDPTISVSGVSHLLECRNKIENRVSRKEPVIHWSNRIGLIG